jgi:hypothetical protein
MQARGYAESCRSPPRGRGSRAGCEKTSSSQSAGDTPAITPANAPRLLSGEEIADVYGCFSSQSFWKAGSARKGSQIGSSLRRAGVTDVGKYRKPLS